MNGIDLVFHQAALRITHCAAEPVLAVEVMINGFQNVLDASLRHKVKKVLAASSASVYGEASYLPMDEAHPFNNRTLYGGLKIANEQILRSYADMHGLQYVVLRPFNLYGARMDVYGVYTEVMVRWLERLNQGQAPIIFGDGKQTMDFVYVSDAADAYIRAADERCDRRRAEPRFGHRNKPARPVPDDVDSGRPSRICAGPRTPAEGQPGHPPPRRGAAGEGPHRLRDESISPRGSDSWSEWHSSLLDVNKAGSR